MLRADLHIHTEYSMDCETPLEKIIERCLIKGICCIAVADHGTAEGALRMQSLAPFPVIVAEEILTLDGEIMGMFLKETIPSGLSLTQTIAQIRDQGALVCAPHPFDTLARSGLGGELLEEYAGKIDVIEVFNARSPFPQPSSKALQFALKHGIVTSAGSDAHTLREIGNAYVEMPEFSGVADFLQALARGRIDGRKTNPLVHFASLWAKIKSKTNRMVRDV